MINNISLLVSVVAVFYVAIRAAMLDRKRPWFSEPTFRTGITSASETPASKLQRPTA